MFFSWKCATALENARLQRKLLLAWILFGFHNILASFYTAILTLPTKIVLKLKPYFKTHFRFLQKQNVYLDTFG